MYLLYLFYFPFPLFILFYLYRKDSDEQFNKSVFIYLMVPEQGKAKGNRYIAADGHDITWHEFNAALAKKLGVNLPATSIPYGLAVTAAKIYYGIHQFLKIKTEPFLTPYRINNGGKGYHFSIQKLKDHFQYATI